MEIPKRRLGKTEAEVTIIGLGGEGMLRTYGHGREASAIIGRALDLGITYFESARAYSDSEVYYGTALGKRREGVFLASKSHARDRNGAEAHLRETLRNMKTDHLDLWQVHDVRTGEDVEEIFGPEGAIHAFARARREGLTRFVGITGHHDPDIIRKCMELFDFDTVLMPVNPAELHYQSFPEKVIPLAQEKDMGIVAMKVYFRGLAARLPGMRSLDPLFRYAATHPVSTIVIGCDTVAQLEENVRFARSFSPMTAEELAGTESVFSPVARRMMYYKP